MKRYSILVIQYGTKHELELCQVDNEPHEIAKAAAEKRLRVRAGDRTVYIPKYDSVRVVENPTPTASVQTAAVDLGPASPIGVEDR